MSILKKTETLLLALALPLAFSVCAVASGQSAAAEEDYTIILPEYTYRVVDTDGNPVPNITFVRVVEPGDKIDQQFSTSQWQTLKGTNGNGEVDLNQVASGVSQWWMNKETGGDIGDAFSYTFPKRDVSTDEIVELVWTGETPRQTAMKCKSKLILTVVDRKGRPLPGAYISYALSDRFPIDYFTRTAYTGEDGIYILPNPDIAEYGVSVEYPAPIFPRYFTSKNYETYTVTVEKEGTTAYTLFFPIDLEEQQAESEGQASSEGQVSSEGQADSDGQAETKKQTVSRWKPDGKG